MRSYFAMWRRIGDIKGRSSRGEFWGGLFWSAFVVVIFALFDLKYIKVLWYIAALAALHILPLFLLLVRRFHDANHSGIWIFVLVLPVIALAFLLIYYHYYDDGTGMYFTFHEFVFMLFGLFALSIACGLITLKFLWAESADVINKWGISPVYADEYNEYDDENEYENNEETADNIDEETAAAEQITAAEEEAKAAKRAEKKAERERRRQAKIDEKSAQRAAADEKRIEREKAKAADAEMKRAEAEMKKAAQKAAADEKRIEKEKAKIAEAEMKKAEAEKQAAENAKQAQTAQKAEAERIKAAEAEEKARKEKILREINSEEIQNALNEIKKELEG